MVRRSVARRLHAPLELVLLSGEDEEPAETEARERIRVMTIHQSEGIEFEAVFVPSLVEEAAAVRSVAALSSTLVLEPLVRGKEDVIAEERRPSASP
jgi:superfamily I DNA/RNA helicase